MTDAMERYGSKIKQRDERVMRSGAVHFPITKRFLRRIAKIGGARP
jgi:hypothetical protein